MVQIHTKGSGNGRAVALAFKEKFSRTSHVFVLLPVLLGSFHIRNVQLLIKTDVSLLQLS